MIDLKYAHKFSKQELIEALVGETERHKKETELLKGAIEALQTLIKQASQRLNLSKYLEV